ncbi:glycosyltransferase [Saccharibacillus kuerlensis]|uniref:Glycosyl transferase family 1 n=1 Tax=Saccharibacillus kuerlensis TaxID=459527 RepID=A0ABQ2L802_9BACL|nr:glycosyltransferase [Saccharibacillus kuerlensis]GGO06425.1 glycosyl transferase family 1 [Saccharibacillus kuerlensis]
MPTMKIIQPEIPVLIYRDQILPPSETFIKSQAERFESFHSYFMGSRLVPGLQIEADKQIIINTGGVSGRRKELEFKLMGPSRSLTRRLKEIQPKLIHAHFGPEGCLAMPIAEKLDIPLIVTFHGYDATTKDEYARKSYYTHRNYLKQRPRLQKKGALFIAVSDFIRGKLISQGYPPNKIVRHYIGINLETFVPDESINRKNTVLFVGRLVEVKGCAYLIRAMAKVQENHPETELVIIGDGPLHGELEQMAASQLKRYRFLGTQPPNVVREWMNKARVFSVPSIRAENGAEEGLGMVFLEAAAMGLPVASFATGGIPEAVEHGKNGYLANERDWKQLGSYIDRLLSEPELWRSFHEHGRERVVRQFDLYEQTRKIEELYKMVIAKKVVGKRTELNSRIPLLGEAQHIL